MPLYQTKCNVCKREDSIFRKIAERDNLPQCGCGGDLFRMIVAPALKPDIEPYQSPNGNHWIYSRAQQKEDLRKSNAFLYEPGVEKDIARNRESVQEKAFAPVANAVDNIIRDMAVSGKLEI
jgi:hypothetical protein